MLNDQELELEQQLKNLPTNPLLPIQSERMWKKINLTKQKSNKKLFYIAAPVIVALATLFILVTANLTDKNQNLALNNQELVAASNEIESNLARNEVALKQMYIKLSGNKDDYKITKQVLNHHIFQLIVEKENYKMIAEEDFSNKFEVSLKITEQFGTKEDYEIVVIDDNKPLNHLFNTMNRPEVVVSGKKSLYDGHYASKENKVVVETEVGKRVESDFVEKEKHNLEYGILPSIYEKFNYVKASEEKDETLGVHGVAILHSYVNLPDKKENYVITKAIYEDKLYVKAENKYSSLLNETFAETILPEGELEFWIIKEILDEEIIVHFYERYDAERKVFNILDDQTDLRVNGGYQYNGDKLIINAQGTSVGVVFKGQENLVDFLPILNIRANPEYKDYKEIEAYLVENDFLTEIGERVYLY